MTPTAIPPELETHRRPRVRWACIALALLLGGCSGSGIGGAPELAPETHTDSSTDAADTADAEVGPNDVAVDVPQDAAPSPPADLFSLGPPVAVSISLDSAAMASLESDPFTFVDGAVNVAGWPVPGVVQVRLGGEFGGERPLSEKAYFVLRFDTPFAGLSELNLNNNVRNRAQMRAQVAFAMGRAFGVPAPRATWAWVELNGITYGLYGLEESIADPAFTAAWFGDVAGDVYRVGAQDADLTASDLQGIARLTGDTSDRSALETLAATLADIEANTADDDLMAALGTVFDMERYIDYVALEIYVTHTDGYAFGPANYALHRGSDGRWTFVASSMERAFRNLGNPWFGRGLVQRLCLRSLACRHQLGSRLEAIVAASAQNGLLGVALSARELVLSVVAEDPRVEASVQQVTGSCNQTINRLNYWTEALPYNLACADPPSVDRDGDGYSGCTDDCNDDDATVNPGMPEVCNIVDDDCSGVIDDAPECPECVPFLSSSGANYDLCFLGRSWADAQQFCVDRGGELASIHSAAEQVAVKDAAFDVLFASWWIGLNDRDSEGAFVWSDGSPVDFEGWNQNEPNDSNGEDCAHLSTWGDGGWNDTGCDALLPQICRLSGDAPQN